ncbi:MAG: radical SAM family heme chaperone HemW [Deltaproteobacteria bacterium]|nr:radical SAM family heme chaperone HemW [Deltaproteobacteria bacterium]
MNGFSLYLHIPYCFHRCPYCDFNTYAVSKVPEKEYTEALLAELDYWATTPEWRGRPVNTIYFGGGTPSLFSSPAIRKVLVAITRLFPINDKAEISLEANPGSVTIDSLTGYREAGVNRISFGSQSFNMSTLKQLGRMHAPEQTCASVENARSAGFSNISLDMIYAVPEQTVSDLRRDLEQTLALEPAHVSAYGLTIEKGTPFYTRFKSGSLILPDDDVILEMMRELDDCLDRHGLKRYEISNYATEGREARHNLAYWNGDDYLGLGAGAHSFYRSSKASASRWSNFALPEKYMKQTVASGRAQSWQDKLDQHDLMFEFFFLGLRKAAGISGRDFAQRFGIDMFEVFTLPIEAMTERELLRLEGDVLCLTAKGLPLADSVIENFLHSSDRLKKSIRKPQQPLAKQGEPAASTDEILSA